MNKSLTPLHIILIVLGVVLFLIIIFVAIAIGVSRSKSNDHNKSDDDLEYLLPPQQTGYVDYDKREAELFGKAGEIFVSQHLEKFINKHGGFILNDYCFEDEDGYSSEIDHILMTHGGLFIIETKTNKGMIIGDETYEKWACIKKEHQDVKRINNPIIQNQGHIAHLRRMMKNKCPKMISVIIFPIADLSCVKTSGVYDMDDALRYIEEISTTSKYSDDYIKKTYNELINIKNMFGISKEKHIQNIKRNHEA